MFIILKIELLHVSVESFPFFQTCASWAGLSSIFFCWLLKPYALISFCTKKLAVGYLQTRKIGDQRRLLHPCNGESNEAGAYCCRPISLLFLVEPLPLLKWRKDSYKDITGEEPYKCYLIWIEVFLKLKACSCWQKKKHFLWQFINIQR